MADMYRVTTLFSGSLVDGGGISQLYFDASAGSAADAQGAVVTFWSLAKDVVHVSTSIDVQADVEEMDLDGSITGVVDGGDTVHYTGADDSDPLPPQTQTLVHWRTGAYIGGRERRGRLFIPCGGESYSVAGVPGGSRKTNLASAIGGLLSDPDASLVVYSRVHNGMATVTSGSIKSQFAVLRGRRP